MHVCIWIWRSEWAVANLSRKDEDKIRAAQKRVLRSQIDYRSDAEMNIEAYGINLGLRSKSRTQKGVKADMKFGTNIQEARYLQLSVGTSYV